MSSETSPAVPQHIAAESYAFVMNVSSLAGATSYALAPGCEIRRAKPDEIAIIKDTLKTIGPAPHSMNELRWETRLQPLGGLVERLPESEWRYFVIALEESDNTIGELQRAFDLAHLELELGFTVLKLAGRHAGVTWNPPRLFHVLQNAQLGGPFFMDVSADEIQEVKVIHAQLQDYNHDLVDVRGLASQFGELKALPHHSPLRFLGYFAILESMLTHTPNPSDPYDSITRQVKKKLALLNRRFQRAIDYSPFGSATADTVWSRMYKYRSLVAHGGTPQFTGDLAVLGSPKTALALLKETVKAVLRQALSEPRLLADLKDC